MLARRRIDVTGLSFSRNSLAAQAGRLHPADQFHSKQWVGDR
jgi:hypothetical protein